MCYLISKWWAFYFSEIFAWPNFNIIFFTLKQNFSNMTVHVWRRYTIWCSTGSNVYVDIFTMQVKNAAYNIKRLLFKKSLRSISSYATKVCLWRLIIAPHPSPPTYLRVYWLELFPAVGPALLGGPPPSPIFLISISLDAYCSGMPYV